MSQGRQQRQPAVPGNGARSREVVKALPPAIAAVPKVAAPPADDKVCRHSRKVEENSRTSIAVEAVAVEARGAAPAPHAPPQGGHVANGSGARALVQPLSPRTSARLQQQQQKQQQKQPDGLMALPTLPTSGTLEQDGPQQRNEVQQDERQAAPAAGPVPRAADHNLRKRQHITSKPAGPPAAAADAAGALPPSKAASRQRQTPAAAQALAVGVASADGRHERHHNTRHAQQQLQLQPGEPAAARRVSFAQGPWAGKFQTCDGHPDHEGQLARQRRSAGSSWGRDLTPSAVRAVESELGEACRPSIDRLKRRVGLLPLRKRSSEYYAYIYGSDTFETTAAAAGTDASKSAGGAALSSIGGGAPGGGRAARALMQKARAAAGLAMQQQQQQQQQQHEQAQGQEEQQAQAQEQQQQAGLDGTMPPKLAATFSRKRSQAELAVPSQQRHAQQEGLQQQQNGAPGNSKRASQRLGGLSGPVGGLSSLGSRGGVGRS